MDFSGWISTRKTKQHVLRRIWFIESVANLEHSGIGAASTCPSCNRDPGGLLSALFRRSILFCVRLQCCSRTRCRSGNISQTDHLLHVLRSHDALLPRCGLGRDQYDSPRLVHLGNDSVYFRIGSRTWAVLRGSHTFCNLGNHCLASHGSL